MNLDACGLKPRNIPKPTDPINVDTDMITARGRRWELTSSQSRPQTGAGGRHRVPRVGQGRYLSMTPLPKYGITRYSVKFRLIAGCRVLLSGGSCRWPSTRDRSGRLSSICVLQLVGSYRETQPRADMTTSLSALLYSPMSAPLPTHTGQAARMGVLVV